MAKDTPADSEEPEVNVGTPDVEPAPAADDAASPDEGRLTDITVDAVDADTADATTVNVDTVNVDTIDVTTANVDTVDLNTIDVATAEADAPIPGYFPPGAESVEASTPVEPAKPAPLPKPVPRPAPPRPVVTPRSAPAARRQRNTRRPAASQPALEEALESDATTPAPELPLGPSEAEASSAQLVEPAVTPSAPEPIDVESTKAVGSAAESVEAPDEPTETAAAAPDEPVSQAALTPVEPVAEATPDEAVVEAPVVPSVEPTPDSEPAEPTPDAGAEPTEPTADDVAEPSDAAEASEASEDLDDDEDLDDGEFDNADPRGEDLAADLPDPGPYALAPDEDEAEELTEDEADDTAELVEDEVSIADPDQLSEATAEAAQATSTRPVRRPAPRASAPPATAKAAAARKNRPTRTRAAAASTHETQRTTPALFVNQSVQELKKVVWPTGAQLRQFFIVVLVFVLIMIAFVGFLDVGVGWLVLKIFGG